MQFEIWPKFVSALEPRVTSNAGFRIFIFSDYSYFFMWNFVSDNKAQFDRDFRLLAETKLHIQKCNTFCSACPKMASLSNNFSAICKFAYRFGCILKMVKWGIPYWGLCIYGHGSLEPPTRPSTRVERKTSCKNGPAIGAFINNRELPQICMFVFAIHFHGEMPGNPTACVLQQAANCLVESTAAFFFVRGLHGGRGLGGITGRSGQARPELCRTITPVLRGGRVFPPLCTRYI